MLSFHFEDPDVLAADILPSVPFQGIFLRPVPGSRDDTLFWYRNTERYLMVRVAENFVFKLSSSLLLPRNLASNPVYMFADKSITRRSVDEPLQAPFLLLSVRMGIESFKVRLAIRELPPDELNRTRPLAVIDRVFLRRQSSKSRVEPRCRRVSSNELMFHTCGDSIASDTPHYWFPRLIGNLASVLVPLLRRII
jgi:hypothetical protein